MKPMTYGALVCFQTLAFVLTCLGQETVKMTDGRQVLLSPDGTWRYTTDSVSTAPHSALDVVRAYLSASSWRERTSLVLNPEKVKPIMEARYERRAWTSHKFELITQTEPTPTQKGWVKVEATIEGRERTAVYYLKKMPNGFRIDWEASVGSNPTSPEEFKATKPTNPVRFRVLAELDDFYNWEFSGAQDVFWSIKIWDADGKKIGNGYIKKSTLEGRQLFKALKEGNQHRIVVEVQYLPNAKSPRAFSISSVINTEGWWIEENDDIVEQGGGEKHR